ncbi:MAG: hypothetical protein QM811_28525 [Pirellulales bacterium]
MPRGSARRLAPQIEAMPYKEDASSFVPDKTDPDGIPAPRSAALR